MTEAEQERARVVAFLDALALSCGSKHAATLNYAATCIHLRMHLTWAEYQEMLNRQERQE